MKVNKLIKSLKEGANIMYQSEIAPTKEVYQAFGFRKWVGVEMPSKHCDSSLAIDIKRYMRALFGRSS